MTITKDEIEVIIEMLQDIDSMWGMKPEERELYEKLTRGDENGQDWNAYT